MPSGTQEAFTWTVLHKIKEPDRILTRKNGKYTEVKDYEFNRNKRNQETFGQSGQTDQYYPSQLPTV